MLFAHGSPHQLTRPKPLRHCTAVAYSTLFKGKCNGTGFKKFFILEFSCLLLGHISATTATFSWPIELKSPKYEVAFNVVQIRCYRSATISGRPQLLLDTKTYVQIASPPRIFEKKNAVPLPPRILHLTPLPCYVSPCRNASQSVSLNKNNRLLTHATPCPSMPS